MGRGLQPVLGGPGSPDTESDNAPAFTGSLHWEGSSALPVISSFLCILVIGLLSPSCPPRKGPEVLEKPLSTPGLHYIPRTEVRGKNRDASVPGLTFPELVSARGELMPPESMNEPCQMHQLPLNSWQCRGSVGKESACNAGRPEFHLWIGKIPWRTEWLPTPLFLPGEFHGQRSLVGYSP